MSGTTNSDARYRSYWGVSNDFEEIFAAFQDPSQEWRRILAEVVGTFFLVLVAVGAPVVGHAFPGTVTRVAAVVAPGMMVMAIVMAIGKVSGAHLNPGVSLAFALRGDFPWIRVPGYVLAQFSGGIIACWTLVGIVGTSPQFGGTYPASGTSASFWAELVLTFGLVTIILGTASGAQNIGVIGAVGVGGYIALAGLWASPISGASMNTVRSLAPDIVSGDYTAWWVYVVAPLLGATLAVAIGYLLRGPGGGITGSKSAQGQIGDVTIKDRNRK